MDFNPRTPCGVRRRVGTGKAHGRYFNPRTPCGVRHDESCDGAWLLIFQSTHPLRGATS